MSRASLLMIGVGLLLLGSLSGCLPGYLRMDISAPQGLNDSTPMHFLVREVDAQQYRTEGSRCVLPLYESQRALEDAL